MQRVAFLLRLRPGTEEAYDKAHAEVWPEMLALLKRAGISEYSIFRRDQLLILIDAGREFRGDLGAHRSRSGQYSLAAGNGSILCAARSGVVRPGERFPMLREVFYMP